MVKKEKFIKILFLSMILFFSLYCNGNSELNDAKSPQEKPETYISAETKNIQLSEDETLIYFSEAKARYLVREQLARLDFPNDAVGQTNDVSGNIVFGKDGSVKSESSRIIVDLSTLKSDEPRRDRYLSRNSLETSKYPEASFIIEEVQGMKWPIEKNIGLVELQLIGQMTVHGVSKSLIWTVEGNILDEDTMQGTAKTEFQFSYFDITIPRLAFILSVEDRIRLEFDFIAEIKD